MTEKNVKLLTLLIVLVEAEVLQIKNNSQDELQVSVTGLEVFAVSSGSKENIAVPDNFTGSITAVPSSLKLENLPKTRVELTLSPMGDAYDVSLLNGFNIKAKVTPIQGRRCKPASCSTNINSICSLRDQVLDEKGNVIGCNNSPFLFKSSCPKAMVTPADVRNVFTCTSDTYLITFG